MAAEEASLAEPGRVRGASLGAAEGGSSPTSPPSPSPSPSPPRAPPENAAPAAPPAAPAPDPAAAQQQQEEEEEEGGEACGVCGSTVSEEGNLILFCDTCDLAVHQLCCSVPTVPEGEWHCAVCASGQRSKEDAGPACMACSSKGGPMLNVRLPKFALHGHDPSRLWMHVCCALWTPEMYLGDGCLVGLEAVDHRRFSLRCALCGKHGLNKSSSAARLYSGSFGVQCAVSTCREAMHATCALRAGWLLEMEGGFSVYCDRHSRARRGLPPLPEPEPLPPGTKGRRRRERVDFTTAPRRRRRQAEAEAAAAAVATRAAAAPLPVVRVCGRDVLTASQAWRAISSAYFALPTDAQIELLPSAPLAGGVGGEAGGGSGGGCAAAKRGDVTGGEAKAKDGAEAAVAAAGEAEEQEEEVEEEEEEEEEVDTSWWRLCGPDSPSAAPPGGVSAPGAGIEVVRPVAAGSGGGPPSLVQLSLPADDAAPPPPPEWLSAWSLEAAPPPPPPPPPDAAEDVDAAVRALEDRLARQQLHNAAVGARLRRSALEERGSEAVRGAGKGEVPPVVTTDEAELLARWDHLVETERRRQAMEKAAKRIRRHRRRAQGLPPVPEDADSDSSGDDSDDSSDSSDSGSSGADAADAGKEREIICCVCGDGDVDDPEHNQIALCDGCDLAVHQQCYGVERLPEGDWFCDRCHAARNGEPEAAFARCAACEQQNGALKRAIASGPAARKRKAAGGGQLWAHVVCATYVHELYFVDPRAMQPVAGVDQIIRARRTLQCLFCRSGSRKKANDTGACVQCEHPSCTRAFHPQCARENGLEMRAQQASNDPNGVRFVAFCDYHRTEPRKYPRGAHMHRYREPKGGRGAAARPKRQRRLVKSSSRRADSDDDDWDAFESPPPPEQRGHSRHRRRKAGGGGRARVVIDDEDEDDDDGGGGAGGGEDEEEGAAAGGEVGCMSRPTGTCGACGDEDATVSECSGCGAAACDRCAGSSAPWACVRCPAGPASRAASVFPCALCQLEHAGMPAVATRELGWAHLVCVRAAPELRVDAVRAVHARAVAVPNVRDAVPARRRLACDVCEDGRAGSVHVLCAQADCLRAVHASCAVSDEGVLHGWAAASAASGPPALDLYCPDHCLAAERAVVVGGAKPGQWQCIWCTLRNEASADACAACHAVRLDMERMAADARRERLDKAAAALPAVTLGGGGGDPDQYCVCRLDQHDEFMVSCDECGEWFHGRCVGVLQAEMVADGDDAEYSCPVCEANRPAAAPPTAAPAAHSSGGAKAPAERSPRRSSPRRRAAKAEEEEEEAEEEEEGEEEKEEGRKEVKRGGGATRKRTRSKRAAAAAAPSAAKRSRAAAARTKKKKTTTTRRTRQTKLTLGRRASAAPPPRSSPRRRAGGRAGR